jgi:predicted dehydrogenase
MYTIAIIGAGQLGSRHLQGLKTAQLDMKIEIVDTSEESLAVARERYNQVAENSHISEIRFIKTVNELSEELDLVIIATGAAPRYAITSDLIKLKKVKNILFEKVLFQKTEEYNEIEKLLAQNHIQAWVNCPRRMYSFYSELKERFSDSSQLIFSVSGGDWGLGCNSIHFIDCLAFISGAKQFTINTAALDRTAHASKRAGYIEFSGMLSAVSERGDILSLISQSDSNSPLIISIQGNKYSVVIDETNRLLHSFENGKWETKNIQVQFQSQLTGIAAEQIVLKGTSQLTPFAESESLHLAFIKPLLEFYNELTGIDSKICPIT